MTYMYGKEAAEAIEAHNQYQPVVCVRKITIQKAREMFSSPSQDSDHARIRHGLEVARILSEG